MHKMCAPQTKNSSKEEAGDELKAGFITIPKTITFAVSQSSNISNIYVLSYTQLVDFEALRSV